MSPKAGGRQASRPVIVECRRCGEWEQVAPNQAYKRPGPKCTRCGGTMRPTSAGGKF